MDGLTRQCIATARNGERCRRAPHPGANVCIMHGASAPQVRQAAQRRLLAGADLAIDCLVSMLEPRPLCTTCGRSDADRDPVIVRACQVVLDRAGFGPQASLTVNREPDPDLSNLTWAEVISDLEVLLDELREREMREKARLTEPRTLDRVLDGELDPGDATNAERPRLQAGYSEPTND